MRVRQGGHNIPPDVIRRRFVSGVKNFHDVYLSCVDFWQWFDNSGPAPQLREEGENP
jgi:predicted ABC-type ATPase